MIFRRCFPALALLLMLNACGDFPELDAAASDAAKNAPYPKLTPTARITTKATQNQIVPETSETLKARVESLQARADRLRAQE
ncbi:hypothetical protein [Roseovarius sp. EL26]|uniref:hypothetical protein n=1 Tax=Roseovarius sp. EL26 TaxID=2126672 RepID=UPI0013C420BE|nr:hypothetical protein [Roseovarius sp. EL26]